MSDILTLGHDAAWHEARRKGIGGSDATAIMNGDWLPLWEEKTGRRESVDLSHVLPVQIGVVTEPLNLLWFERVTGNRVSARGEMRTHTRYQFMRCTLDGLTDHPAVIQAKHVNAFSKIDEIAQKYIPQVTHEMAVCGLERAFLSVFVGTLTYEWVEIALDEFYAATLIDREREFWDFVEKDEPPPSKDPVATPVLPEKWRSVSMEGNNFWAEQAGIWLANRDAAKQFDKAAKEIKALLEPDVGTASGHGIVCKRAKNGALSIKEA